MNTRLAFEDYTALHHRLDSLRAIDEKPERSQLEFENRPAREMMKEEASHLDMEARPQRETVRETTRETRHERLPEMTRETIREDASELALQSRPQREMTKVPEEKAPAMWRSILQLRVLLPYVSKLLPLLESGLTGQSPHSPAQNNALAAVEKSSLEIQNSHRDLRLQLQDQAVEFKRVDEQLERLREATERNTLEQQELIEDLKSVAGTIKLVGWSAVVLLAGLIGVVAYVALHLKH